MRSALIPILKDNLLIFGESGINPMFQWNISQNEMISLWKKYSKLGLYFYFDEPTLNGVILIYLDLISKLGGDINIIKSEINNSQKNDIISYKHSVSMIKLYYHYLFEGIDIKINKTSKIHKSPDFTIEGIHIDLKVRHEKSWSSRNLSKFDNISNNVEYDKYFSSIRTPSGDLLQAIKSRCEKGFLQADALILDLSNHFHTWNYHRLAAYQEKGVNIIMDKPIVPQKGQIIIFSPRNTNVIDNNRYFPKAKWVLVSQNNCA